MNSGKGSTYRLAGALARSRISTLMISMFATVASLYVAGRLWQDAENRVFLTKELDRITGLGKSAINVDDTLKIIACREQKKILSSLEMELAAARQQGFLSKDSKEINKAISNKKPSIVIGVFTSFGHKNKRDIIRKSWMLTGPALKKLEDEKGIIIRFVIGRSSFRGDSLDKSINSENKVTNDFIILENHVEAEEEISKKVKHFYAHAAETWNADFYAKANDDVYINTDSLSETLAMYMDKPRAYIGCMKSGEVFTEE